jgi:hypothetical protein
MTHRLSATDKDAGCRPTTGGVGGAYWVVSIICIAPWSCLGGPLVLESGQAVNEIAMSPRLSATDKDSGWLRLRRLTCP